MNYFVLELNELFESVLRVVKSTVEGNDMDGTVKISGCRENAIDIDFEDGTSFEVIIHQTHASSAN